MYRGVSDAARAHPGSDGASPSRPDIAVQTLRTLTAPAHLIARISETGTGHARRGKSCSPRSIPSSTFPMERPWPPWMCFRG